MFVVVLLLLLNWFAHVVVDCVCRRLRVSLFAFVAVVVVVVRFVVLV